MSRRGVEVSSVDYESLYRWLAVATKGLSDVARARIREEITDHFHEALDAGLDRGLPENLAAERAIESLGSPRAARRAFRRTYLTRSQAYLVRRFIDVPSPARSGWTMPRTSNLLLPYWDADRDRRLRPYMVAIFFATTVLGVALDPYRSAIHLGLLGVMIAAALVCVLAVPRLARGDKNRTAVAVGALAEFVFLSAWFMAPAISPVHELRLRLGILAAWAVFFVIRYGRTLLKLSNHPEPPA